MAKHRTPHWIVSLCKEGISSHWIVNVENKPSLFLKNHEISTWTDSCSDPAALLDPVPVLLEQPCSGELLLLESVCLVVWTDCDAESGCRKSAENLCIPLVLIWGLKRAHNLLDTVVLRLIHVPNKPLPLKSMFQESQQESGLIPAPSFLPSISSCVWLTQCFLLPCKFPHKFLALCISPPLLALLMHLISLKLGGFLHLPSTKDGFTFQAAGQKT